MKKVLLLTLITILILTTALGLVACANPDDSAPTPIAVTFYIGDDKYENISAYSNENVFDCLRKYCEEKKIAIAYTGSSYGAYLTELGSLKENYEDHSFIAFYHNDENYKDVSAYAKTITKGDTTLYLSGMGASSVKLIDGGIYAFELDKW